MPTPIFIKNISRYPKILIALFKDFFQKDEQIFISPPHKNLRQSTINRTAQDNNIHLSIIIPVYNVEIFLKKCLDSLSNQKTNINIEIIIINDCSPDNSKEVIDNFKHLKNTRVINLKENTGISSVRNRGINAAKGQFIAFLDSDDILCEGSIQYLYDLAIENNADIVEGDYIRFSLDSEIKHAVKEQEHNHITLRNSKQIASIGSGYLWGKLFNRHLFDKINFPEGLSVEDQITKPLLLRFAKTYIKTNKPVIYYRNNEHSITNNIKKNNYAWDHLEAMQYTLATIKDLNLPIDNLTYTLMLHDSTKLLHGRTKYLEKEKRRYMIRESHNILQYIESNLDKPLKLTIHQKIARFAIYRNYYYTWSRISPFL
ncbi:glycosyltransferase [Endozoicomonas sp.]|nr:glycosyltransferase [Endozoicomonas sp.]